MNLNKIYIALKYRIWKYFHNIRCKKYRKRYTNKDLTILSMNCVGGILTHDLGQMFLSPTVNVGFNAHDFMKFCENIHHYLTIETMERCYDSKILNGRKHLIASFGDIHLSLRHYKSLEDAQTKWNNRKKRINWDKIVVLCSDRDGMTPELMDRFDRLPYKKVMFTHLPVEGRGDHYVYIKGYENEPCVGIITDPVGWTGLRPIDQFDWVKFLNEV